MVGINKISTFIFYFFKILFLLVHINYISIFKLLCLWGPLPPEGHWCLTLDFYCSCHLGGSGLARGNAIPSQSIRWQYYLTSGKIILSTTICAFPNSIRGKWEHCSLGYEITSKLNICTNFSLSQIPDLI